MFLVFEIELVQYYDVLIIYLISFIRTLLFIVLHKRRLV